MSEHLGPHSMPSMTTVRTIRPVLPLELLLNVIEKAAIRPQQNEDSEDDTPRLQSGQYKTLLALAKTCTALYRPAVSELWKFQENLSNLMKCLSQDAWSMKGDRMVFDQRRGMDQTVWNRVDFHASLIRHLHISSWTAGSDDFLGILEMLQTRRGGRRQGGKPTLPNLDTLTCRLDGCGFAVIEGLPMLWGSQIKSLTVDLTPAEDDADHPVIPRMFSNILYGSMHTLVAALRQESYCAKPSMQRLTDLHLKGYMPTHESLPIIACLPYLRSLTMVWGRQIPSGSLPSSRLSQPVFPRLEKLVLNNIDDTGYYPDSFALLKCCTQLLVTFPPKALKSLSIYTHFLLEGPEELEELLRTLSDISLSSKLEGLFLDITQGSIWEGKPNISLQHLQPLLSFSKLEKVFIDFGLRDCAQFKDSDFEIFARCWPRLRSFYLVTRHSPAPTLRALLHLVAGCPLLELLSMTFNPTVLPRHEQEREKLKFPNFRVVELGVGYTKITERQVPPLTMFLARLFPRIRFLKVHPGIETDEDARESIELWNEMEGLLAP